MRVIPALFVFLFSLLSIDQIGTAQVLEVNSSTGPLTSPLQQVMPRATDNTRMWWRDGFPGIIPEAHWRRMVSTGRYWFLLDTDSVSVASVGPVSTPIGDIPGAQLGLKIRVGGKEYHCTEGGAWSRFAGPRLIASGRFLQRADITDLVFKAADGTPLNVEARFETVAWADQLGLIFSARPGLNPLAAGDGCFGRVNGGHGLAGGNRFVIPPQDAYTPPTFTCEFWAYVPLDYKAGDHAPWLMCKNQNEHVDGNYGVLIGNGAVPSARLNIGGGSEGSHAIRASSRHAFKLEAWNHLALRYDGTTFQFYVNGKLAGEKKIGKARVPNPGLMTFGNRGDSRPGQNGYAFRGVVDEIRIYDRALDQGQLRGRYQHPERELQGTKPIKSWGFRKDVEASKSRQSAVWRGDVSLELSLKNHQGEIVDRWTKPVQDAWRSPDWQQASFLFDPVAWKKVDAPSGWTIQANERATGKACHTHYDADLGCHRVKLDGIQPILPKGETQPSHSSMERIRLVLTNDSNHEKIARLLFEKTHGGFKQRIGTPITGVSAILRDTKGNPTGIPVQLSKNWHFHPEGGVYSGQWFHGVSQVRLQPKQRLELELSLVYGHWGGVPAASHAQLSLIGWGSNQLWEQSALGSWGESVCYEPEQVQANCLITDVRPLMVHVAGASKWRWTSNVGGGDIFRLFDPAGKRVVHAGMQTEHHRLGPCLTEVSYTGQVGTSGIRNRATVSLGRTDDLVTATYRIRMDVSKPVAFSRFVVFQTGADTYACTQDQKLAVGNESGPFREWMAEPGGNTYRGKPIECTGRVPWVSLHKTSGNPFKNDADIAWANRGFVIREWSARLGGKEASPWVAERGLDRGLPFSTMDIIPPPGVKRLLKGDFVEATIEHVIIPQFASEYYGPNQALRTALTTGEDRWEMMLRQAKGDDLTVAVSVGKLEHRYPDVRVACVENKAAFKLTGGLGYVPLTFTGLSSHRGFELRVDGKPLDQAVHGSDFWQTDYDSGTKRWSQTFNIPTDDGKTRVIEFGPVAGK